MTAVPEYPRIEQDLAVREAVHRALTEDVGEGDATTLSLVPPRLGAEAVIVAREECVVAGLAVAASVFREVDDSLDVSACRRDGEGVGVAEELMRVSGPARSLLTAERTALNFLQRMTGIATLTRRFVQAVADSHTTILDTRKTTPGLRALEKYAVLCGGGRNHRFGLYDMVLIKDNHRHLWGLAGKGGLDAAVRAARRAYPKLPIEVEVENEEDLETVLAAQPDWVLLDNMGPEALRRCVRRCAGRCKLEASGGITLDNVAQVADTGVDAISLGCLTHSAPAADLSLEIL